VAYAWADLSFLPEGAKILTVLTQYDGYSSGLNPVIEDDGGGAPLTTGYISWGEDGVAYANAGMVKGTMGFLITTTLTWDVTNPFQLSGGFNRIQAGVSYRVPPKS